VVVVVVVQGEGGSGSTWGVLVSTDAIQKAAVVAEADAGVHGGEESTWRAVQGGPGVEDSYSAGADAGSWSPAAVEAAADHR
jgi:hypothetical protein